MAKHTELPWKCYDNGRTCAIESDEIEDGYVAQELTHEDAEFACRAANVHYPMLTVLKGLTSRAKPPTVSRSLWKAAKAAIATAQGTDDRS